MADHLGVELKARLEILWKLQSSARECLAYVTAIGEAARKLGKTIDEHHIFTSLYVNNARSALLLAAHLVEDDKQSISAASTAEYAKSHLEEFVRFHANNTGKSKAEREQTLLTELDSWLAKFRADAVVRDIKHVRDWTLAHTDKRSVTRSEDVPGIPFAEIRRILGIINEFVNDLLIKIEDRALESGEVFLEPDVKREMFDTVARLTVISEIFAKEIGEQGVGPALIRTTELKKLLEGDTK